MKNSQATCPVCQTTFWRNTKHLLRVKIPTCSYRCNGVLRGAEWKPFGHLGPKARTPESYAKAAMYGAKNPAWKGGVTYVQKHGLHAGAVYVRCPPAFKAMSRKDGYVMRHRLMMARRIGRILTRIECVHHVNHKARDDRDENLELWPTNRDHKLAEHGRFVNGVANLWCPKDGAPR